MGNNEEDNEWFERTNRILIAAHETSSPSIPLLSNSSSSSSSVSNLMNVDLTNVTTTDTDNCNENTQ